MKLRNTLLLVYLFFSCNSYAQGQYLVPSSSQYELSTKKISWNYPEASLRIFQYLIQANLEKNCFLDEFSKSSNNDSRIENLQKLTTVIKTDFPDLTTNPLSGGILDPESLYKTILFRIYHTVNSYSADDSSEQIALEYQNQRYDRILIGYQLLLEKNFNLEKSSNPLLKPLSSLTPFEILNIKKSLILVMLESVNVQIFFKRKNFSQNSACFPRDNYNSYDTNQMINYIEIMFQNLNALDNPQAIDRMYKKPCDELVSLLDVLLYSRISSLNTELFNISGFGGVQSQQDDFSSSQYCSMEPFIDKIQRL